jgi:hypothetical protein
MFFNRGKKSATPKSLEHWYADMAAVERLRELLADPVLQLAVNTLCAGSAPNGTTIKRDNETNAAAMNWLAGYNDAFRDLQKLTKLPNHLSDLPAEWSHVSTDDL